MVPPWNISFLLIPLGSVRFTGHLTHKNQSLSPEKMYFRFTVQQKKVKDNPPEMRSGVKWNSKQEVNNLIDHLEHKEIVASVQINREGLGTRIFKPFRFNIQKVKQKAVVNELTASEDESRRVSLM